MPRLLFLLALALVVAPGSAEAQSRPAPAPSATPAELARAKELRSKGHQNFDEQRYAEALALYKESYRLSGDPALLYNIGRAHQLLNEAPEALGVFETFLAAASPELKAKVQGLDETVAEARKKVATVTLTSNVTGARVLVRKKEIGKTPLRGVRLLAGEADIEILSDLHEPLTRTITLQGGESATLELNLTPKKNTDGLLVVRSPVPGARVLVDGRLLGGAPAEVLLDPGEHRVSLSAEGHNDTSQVVVIAAGERRELNVDLTKKAKPSRCGRGRGRSWWAGWC
jgi:hypothetical protein